MPGLLLKLVVAHLAGDYLLQTDQDAAGKRKWSVLARHTGVHGLLLAGVAVTEPRHAGVWYLGLVLLMLSHAMIDGATSRWTSAGLPRLVVDQALHLLAIAGLVYGTVPAELGAAQAWAAAWVERRELWWHATGLLASIWVGGVVVGIAVRPYARTELKPGETRPGLARAGRTIGYCERALIYLFMVTDSQALIGFVIAAKALMRLPEARDPVSRESSEYYLIGTLLSIVWAVCWGLVIRAALRP